MAESCQCRSFADLPADFVHLVFEQLGLLDVIAASQTCKFWKTVCDAGWELRATARWQHSTDRWDRMKQAGAWKKLYQARHQLDATVKKKLELVCFPLHRRDGLQAIEELGLDCVDALTTVAHSQGAMMMGQRYWAWLALTQVQMSRCSQQLAIMLRKLPTTDTTAFEGALLLAQVHCPTLQLQWVREAIDLLAQEFKRRMAEQNVTGGKPALLILSQLLFGSPDPTSATTSACSSSSSSSSRQPPWVVGAASAQPDVHAPLPDPAAFVPAPGAGLGLHGNAGDYYNPNNSLVHMVLQHRTGIPISLALLHMTVARLAGVQVEMLGLPGIVINRLPGSEPGEALYVDVFDGGKVLSAAQAQVFAMSMGLPPYSTSMGALTPTNVLGRMCNNLVDIYQNQFNMDMLATVLRFATSVSPTNTELIYLRFMVAMRGRHFREAHGALAAMEVAEGQGVVDESSVAHASAMRALLAQAEAQEASQHAPAPPGRPRPANVLYRAGDVVRHREYGYRAVVYEWDPSCQADSNWQNATSVQLLPNGGSQPFYRLLVDVRDRPVQCTYVPQDNLQLLEEAQQAAAAAAGAGTSSKASGASSGAGASGVSTRGTSSSAASTSKSPLAVQHPNMGKYFDGQVAGRGQYVPNAYLRSRFPHDYVEEPFGEEEQQQQQQQQQQAD